MRTPLKSSAIREAKTLPTLRRGMLLRMRTLTTQLANDRLHLTKVARIQGELNVLRMTLESVDALISRAARGLEVA